MKKMKWILGTALAVVALAVVAQPALANCATGTLMDTVGGDPGETPIASNPQWTYGEGIYGNYNIPPISPSFVGYFWGLGQGDKTTNGVGNDNGAYPSSQWVTFYSGDFPGGTYHYPAYIRNPVGGPVNWTDPRVDGCPIFGECACMFFQDEWNGQGYFAIFGDDSTPAQGFNYDFGLPGDVESGLFRMAPIPKPVIASSAREPGTNNLLLNVTVPPFGTAGNYQREGCNCMAGYRVFAAVVPRGGPPPAGRVINTQNGWNVLTTTTGAAQPVTALGATVGVRVPCGGSNTDVYIATQLVADSGYGSDLVSQNGTRVECGPQIADPVERPRTPLGRTPPDREGRGKN
jgi:hypothetical protein